MRTYLTRQEELLGEHLLYEIQMLHEIRKALNGERVSDQIITNALMESFCVHAAISTSSLLRSFGTTPSTPAALPRQTTGAP